MISPYDPKNVFNVDETGLFCKCVPDRILSFKSDKYHGGKSSKERIILFLCTNMDGSEISLENQVNYATLEMFGYSR